jgi:hypothetical protein
VWPEAVNWLLITFAPESSLEKAVISSNLSGKEKTVREKQFGRRLQMEASTMGSLVSLSELKSLFSQGLSEPVRSLFAAHQPSHELEDTTPLSVLVSRAELLETGTASRPSSSKVQLGPISRLPTLATPDVSEDEMEIPDREDIQAMVLKGQELSKVLVCFFCYRVGHWWLECPCLAHLLAEKKE